MLTPTEIEIIEGRIATEAIENGQFAIAYALLRVASALGEIADGDHMTALADAIAGGLEKVTLGLEGLDSVERKP